jgi:hypothetical protein
MQKVTVLSSFHKKLRKELICVSFLALTSTEFKNFKKKSNIYAPSDPTKNVPINYIFYKINHINIFQGDFLKIFINISGKYMRKG